METETGSGIGDGFGRRVWRALASPRVTVALLLWLGVLTVWGTLYQTANGLYAAQQRFFHSWFFWTAAGWLPLPGWYGSMAVLAVNLVPSMISRFPRRSAAAGLWVIHLGLFVFLLGGWITRQYGRESDLKLAEGDQSSVAVAPRSWELAFWKETGGRRQVVAFDVARLAPGRTLSLPEWNLSVRVERIAPNGDAGVDASGAIRAIRPRPVDRPETALPVAELKAPGGAPVLLAGTGFEEGAPVDATGVYAALRRQRHALPFTVKLIDFKKEFHPNSGIPREFSSRVEVTSDGVTRDVLISMNKPFRLGNFTLFQSSYETAPDGREASVFAVAENKGRLLPYVASALIALGMLMLYLPRLFVRRPASAARAAAAALVLALPLTTAAAAPEGGTGGEAPVRIPADVAKDLGRLPVLENGRVMPLDTYARLAMTQLRGMENAPSNETATAWLLRLMTDPRSTVTDPVLLINHPEAAEAIGLEPKKPRDRYAYHAVSHGRDRLLELAQSIYRKPTAARREAEADLLRLWQSVELFESIVEGEQPHLPVGKTGAAPDWTPPAKSPEGAGWTIFQLAVRSGDPALMRQVAAKWTDQSLDAMAPRERQRVLAEILQDRSRLKPVTMTLYLLAFLLAIPVLRGGRAALGRAAVACAALGVAGGTALLGLRVFITAMPPVTNLYSSFLFVGWGAALIALAAARRMPAGYGALFAGAAGFLSLWVSMAFAPSSDTMAPVVAVLNSKFWLLTHVLTIALGYSGCLIAGLAAHVYLVLVARRRSADAVARVRAFLYGTLRFGLLFAFIGTVTGGVWADQSWGRFWGWDPKENGALLIVLWCSALLHARPARIIGDNGFAAGCIAGNAIVAVAWLGVNLLGVGLHSYGFTSGLARGLLLFCGAELALALALWVAAGREKAVSSSTFQVSS